MFLDFKAIKAAVSIEDAANLLKLALKRSANQLRGGCPACGNDDERILALTPDRGLFYCFDAKIGGDCLALVQHITGLEVKDAAEFLQNSLAPKAATIPQKPVGRKQPATAFDPAKFEAGLEYNDQVKALGYTESEAKAFRVGAYRGNIYFPSVYPSGAIAGWSKLVDGVLIPPKTWLQDTNVVAFPKRA